MRTPPIRNHEQRKPRITEHVPGMCWMCDHPAQKGQLCKECGKTVKEQWRNEERREAEHLKARAKEAQRREAEHEAWREQQREKRRKEAEAYEILKEERRCAQEAEKSKEWHEFLRDLALMSQRGAK